MFYTRPVDKKKLFQVVVNVIRIVRNVFPKTYLVFFFLIYTPYSSRLGPNDYLKKAVPINSYHLIRGIRLEPRSCENLVHHAFKRKKFQNRSQLLQEVFKYRFFPLLSIFV